MITFKILGKKYPIPTCWMDVTYDQYVYHSYPRTFTETLHCFTGISLELLENAQIRNIEKLSLALAFMTLSPKMDKTSTVAGYVTIFGPQFESLRQFEDLRALIKDYPAKKREEFTYEDYQKESEVYLSACAIYLQKVIDGKYDSSRVPQTKEYLRKQSCVEVISNGAFFFAKALNLLPPSTSLFQNITQRMKKFLQALPGYQKTLDFLQRSSASLAK